MGQFVCMTGWSVHCSLGLCDCSGEIMSGSRSDQESPERGRAQLISSARHQLVCIVTAEETIRREINFSRLQASPIITGKCHTLYLYFIHPTLTFDTLRQLCQTVSVNCLSQLSQSTVSVKCFSQLYQSTVSCLNFLITYNILTVTDPTRRMVSSEMCIVFCKYLTIPRYFKICIYT